jgi:hypothetical protein
MGFINTLGKWKPTWVPIEPNDEIFKQYMTSGSPNVQTQCPAGFMACGVNFYIQSYLLVSFTERMGSSMGKNRVRKNRIYFHLDDNEKKQMEQKMDLLGIRNRDAFARKLLLDGYIVQVDTKPTADLIRLVKNATTNINQIAKRANESGSVYENDVLDLLAEVNRLVPLVIEAHSNIIRLGEL